MTTTRTRKRLLTVGVALMLVIAGCSSSTQQPTPEAREPTDTATPGQSPTPRQTPTSTPTATPSPTPTPTPTPQPTATPEQNDTLTYGKVTYHNATESKLREVNQTMAHFFEKLPENESERMATVAAVANETCFCEANATCTGEVINETVFTTSSKTKAGSQRLYHVARVMKENFNSRINPSRIRRVARTSAKIGQYTTIVGSFNNYQKAACAFDRDDPETVEDYYLASATLGFELLMFQYGMYYKTAFKANRALSHRRTYRVVQSTFGDKALGLMMSGSYYLTHATLQSAPNFVRNRADEMNITISENATAPDQHARVEEFVGSEVVPRNLSAKASRCYEKIKDQNESGGGLLEKAVDTIEDVKEQLLAGDYTVEEVVDSAKDINASELSDQQMKRLKDCMEKESE